MAYKELPIHIPIFIACNPLPPKTDISVQTLYNAKLAISELIQQYSSLQSLTSEHCFKDWTSIVVQTSSQTEVKGNLKNIRNHVNH